jgi:two-component system response regulator AtoC
MAGMKIAQDGGDFIFTSLLITLGKDWVALMARILIIDDEKQQLMLRASIMRAHGYEVVAAFSGRQAMELSQQQHFDLVITDWLMPEMTGLDISRRLKTLHPEIRIILLTGWGSIVNHAEIRANGIDCLLSKPCDVEKLIAQAEEILSLSGERPFPINAATARSENHSW